MSLLKAWRAFWCSLGRHKRLHTVNLFGAARHVGCPDCRREFAMHDGMRSFLPWDGEFETMYADFGHDVAGYRRRWLVWLETKPEYAAQPQETPNG